MADSEEELKTLLKMKEESEKVKVKSLSRVQLNSWQIDGETMETVRDFILGCSRITADGDCSHEIKRRLLLGRKAMTNLDSILKSRDISLSTEVCIFKAMVFPVVMRRRQWQPTPVFLPGKSHGWRSLVGRSPWGHKESDTTEQLSTHTH